MGLIEGYFKGGVRMFLAISDTVFINTDYVSSMAIEEHFTEEGEKWFVRMYGKFDVPEEARERWKHNSWTV